MASLLLLSSTSMGDNPACQPLSYHALLFPSALIFLLPPLLSHLPFSLWNSHTTQRPLYGLGNPGDQHGWQSWVCGAPCRQDSFGTHMGRGTRAQRAPSSWISVCSRPQTCSRKVSCQHGDITSCSFPRYTNCFLVIFSILKENQWLLWRSLLESGVHAHARTYTWTDSWRYRGCSSLHFQWLCTCSSGTEWIGKWKIKKELIKKKKKRKQTLPCLHWSYISFHGNGSRTSQEQ